MEDKQIAKQVQKVTWYVLLVNVVLATAKLLAGVFGKSAAMLADGVHSLSDLVVDIVMLVCLSMSAKSSDLKHGYGYGKFETIATFMVSIVLFVVGLVILVSGVQTVAFVLEGGVLDRPEPLVLYVAGASIVIKEVLYQYANHQSKRYKNTALKANAWHQRTDALATLATCLGVAGAMFLGENWRILDPIVGIAVSALIIKIAINLFWPTLQELLEFSLPDSDQQKVEKTIESIPAIQQYHCLRTRKVGRTVVVDVHICLEPTISFVESHQICLALEKALKEQFGQQTIANIRTEPLLSTVSKP